MISFVGRAVENVVSINASPDEIRGRQQLILEEVGFVNTNEALDALRDPETFAHFYEKFENAGYDHGLDGLNDFQFLEAIRQRTMGASFAPRLPSLSTAFGKSFEQTDSLTTRPSLTHSFNGIDREPGVDPEPHQVATAAEARPIAAFA